MKSEHSVEERRKKAQQPMPTAVPLQPSLLPSSSERPAGRPYWPASTAGRSGEEDIAPRVGQQQPCHQQLTRLRLALWCPRQALSFSLDLSSLSSLQQFSTRTKQTLHSSSLHAGVPLLTQPAGLWPVWSRVQRTARFGLAYHYFCCGVEMSHVSP